MSRSFYKNYCRKQFSHKIIRQFTSKRLRVLFKNNYIPDGGIYKKIANKYNVGQDIYEPFIVNTKSERINKNNITRFGKKLVSIKEFNKNKHRRNIRKYTHNVKMKIADDFLKTFDMYELKI